MASQSDTLEQVETAAIPGEEYLERQRRAVAGAAERGLAALLVWSRGGTSADFYGDVLYLANHHSPFPPNQDTGQWSGRSYSVLLLPVNEEPTLIVDIPDYARERIYVEDIRHTVRVPEAAAALLKEKGLVGERIGLVGRDVLLLSSYQTLQSRLDGKLKFEPADEIVESLRRIKSASEIDLLRHAANVGIGWMSTMMEAVAPGRTAGEVVGEGLRFLAAKGGFPYDVAVAAGDDSEHLFAHIALPTWDYKRPLADGELIHIDAWGPVNYYFTDFVRSSVVGRKASAAQKEILEGAIAIIEHIVAGVRPGVRVAELYDRGASWLVANGFGRHGAGADEAGTDFGQLFPAFGHGIGVGLEGPWITEDEPTVLEENMALAIEALIGRPGLGAAGFEQEVVVTANGCDVLTEACPPRWWD